MRNILGTYKNGNYTVTMYEDGTKVRENNLDNLTPAFAENCDVKITDKCDGGCEYCYEGCTRLGEHADLLSYNFINSLHPYTELALNGNDLSHPQLIKFLHILRCKNVIANITVNQKHFMQHYNFIEWLINENLIHGIGVSLVDADSLDFFHKIRNFPNAVIHTIAGVTTIEQYKQLAEHNCKILILGYKTRGRGVFYKQNNSYDIEFRINELKNYLPILVNTTKLVSFDNLAIEQLDIKNTLKLTDTQWNEFYMGDDGKYTFYIDLVKGEFAKNSVSDKRYKIEDNMTIDDMFNIIRKA
jgi:hypothetical protein